MSTSLFDSFDYVLCKEYNTILLRCFQPIEHSYVRSQIFDKKKHLSPVKPIALLRQDLLELHEACIGQHKNTGLVTVKENVRVEICDCIFRLMVLDVSLGGEDYYDIPWANEFVEGMEYAKPLPGEGIHDIIVNLESLSITESKRALELMPSILNYLGIIASSYELTLSELIGEIQRGYRWSRRSQDMEKRLASMTYVVYGKPVPEERWKWFKDNMPTMATTVIEALKVLLK